jgi:hypothetical protein
MHRLAWAAATLVLAAVAFAAGRMTLGVRIMPEIVATLPGDESQFSRELDARFRERFPVGTPQDKLIGYLVGANFLPDWPRRDANAGVFIFNGWLCAGSFMCCGEQTPWGRSPILAALTRAIVCETPTSDSAGALRLTRAGRLAQQSPARAIAIAAAFLGRLVGEAAMVGAIGSGRGGRAAITKFGSRRVAERPAAHRLF